MNSNGEIISRQQEVLKFATTTREQGHSGECLVDRYFPTLSGPGNRLNEHWLRV